MHNAHKVKALNLWPLSKPFVSLVVNFSFKTNAMFLNKLRSIVCNPVNAPIRIIRNEQRTIGGLSQTTWTVFCITRILHLANPCKTICKDFPRS